MQKLLISTVLFAVAVPAFAQQAVSHPPEGSDWHKVQVLPVGTPIYVTVGKHITRCVLMNVDADSVTCNNGKDTAFQRSEVNALKVSHRTRSTLVGLGLGWAVSGILGVAAENTKNYTAAGAMGAAGLAVLVAAPIIGYKTDFTRSTIYKGN
jgi:hypothetical protein